MMEMAGVNVDTQTPDSVDLERARSLISELIQLGVDKSMMIDLRDVMEQEV